MDMLAGYGSDSSSSSEGNPNQPTSKTNPLLSALGDVSEGSSTEETDKERTTKKARLETPYAGIFSGKKPPTTSTHGPSMVHWDEDYLSGPLVESELAERYKRECQAQVARKLSEIESNKGSWADHLKEQHEFHNPHFFSSVVELFGIQDHLGSSLGSPEIEWGNLHDYEKMIVPKLAQE